MRWILYAVVVVFALRGFLNAWVRFWDDRTMDRLYRDMAKSYHDSTKGQD